MEEDKKMAPIIQQNPEIIKVRRRIGILMLLALAVVTIPLIMIGMVKSLLYIVPVLVFIFMMYYARFLQKHPETKEYGKKLEQIEITGFRTWLKIIIIGIIIIIITLIIIFTWLL
jgi:hypothetical protein